jgi:hypothetical protein
MLELALFHVPSRLNLQQPDYIGSTLNPRMVVYVRLTTHNIACWHHHPMSHFVSAEDTALYFYPITYPSQLFPMRHTAISQVSGYRKFRTT